MRVQSAAAIAAAILTACLFFSRPVAAHEGHDHGAPPPPVAATAAPRTEAASETFELVAVGRSGELTIYLDRFRTNEPVEGATIELETPDGPRTAEAAGGSYRLPTPWLARPGRYDLMFTVTAGQESDLLTASLVVPEPPAAAQQSPNSLIGTAVATELKAAIATTMKERLARNDPAVLMAGTGGFAFGILAMALFGRRRAAAGTAIAIMLIIVAGTAALAHEGHDHGDAKKAAALPADRDLAQRLPDGSVFVPKPTQRILAIRTIMAEPATHRRSIELPGRIIPDPNASGYVQAAVSGRLSPPPTGFPRLGTPVRAGDVLAYVTPPLTAAEMSDHRQRQGELDQQILIVERRIARYETLAQSGAVARAQLEEARIELNGLKERRAALDQIWREPVPLVAPVPGIVAAANAVSGQIAETNAVVFQIVDPERLWIEALAFEAVTGTGAASARSADGRVLGLAYQGSGLADRNQAIPIHFTIEGNTRGLRLGQLVTVLAETDEGSQGLAIPRAGVLRGSNGQSVVYEHTGAERFEPREVRVEPLDGERVLVGAGLGPGKRVVTQGAELLNQIR